MSTLEVSYQSIGSFFSPFTNDNYTLTSLLGLFENIFYLHELIIMLNLQITYDEKGEYIE